MGEINRKKRQMDIRQKRKKREKIKKLKERLLAGDLKSEERQRIIDKIKRLSPTYPVAELLKAKASGKE